MDDKPCDLEDRTLAFAQEVRAFIRKLPKTIANVEDMNLSFELGESIMKLKLARVCCVIVALLLLHDSDVFAYKRKVAQSGMTYLAISLGARESAMGSASVASVRGIQGIFYNPAVLADIEHFGATFNQVNWLVDSKLYGVGAAYSLGGWGTIGVDLVYMDFGEIIGTQRVDKSVDERGFRTTGDIGVEEYAIGFSYGYRISDRFAFGFKIKRAHEDLGFAEIVTAINELTQEKQTRGQDWALNAWGFDFGTTYNTGYKSLVFAMAFQNFSTDLKYWFEEFQMPLVLRMGLSMDLMDVLASEDSNFDLNVSVDALHPNDNLERIYAGAELVFADKFALRGGFKSNHDVETTSLGVGLNFNMSGYAANLDYAFVNANYFENIHRLSFQFSF